LYFLDLLEQQREKKYLIDSFALQDVHFQKAFKQACWCLPDIALSLTCSQQRELDSISRKAPEVAGSARINRVFFWLSISLK